MPLKQTFTATVDEEGTVLVRLPLAMAGASIEITVEALAGADGAEIVLDRETLEPPSQNELFLNLLRMAPLDEGVPRAHHAIVEAAARVVRVARASVWLYDKRKTKLECKDLYELPARAHSSGASILVGDFPLGVAFSPLVAKAYVANGIADTVSVIDVTTEIVTTIPAFGDFPFGVAFTPDGSKAYVTLQSDNAVRVINGVTDAPGITISVGDAPRGVAFTPDGSKAYVVNNNAGTVTVIDALMDTVITTITVGIGNAPEAVAFTPDGVTAYVTNSGGNTVSVIDVASNSVMVPPIAVGTIPLGVAISPDGATAYVTNSVDGEVSVIRVVDNTVLGSPIMVGAGPVGVAFAPDGTKAYVVDGGVGQGGSVSVIATGSVPARAMPPTGFDVSGTLLFATALTLLGVAVVASRRLRVIRLR